VLPALMARLHAAAPCCDLVLRLGDYRSLPGTLETAEAGTIAGWLRDDPPASARTRVLRHAPWVLLRDAASAAVMGDLDTFCARQLDAAFPIRESDATRYDGQSAAI